MVSRNSARGLGATFIALRLLRELFRQPALRQLHQKTDQGFLVRDGDCAPVYRSSLLRSGLVVRFAHAVSRPTVQATVTLLERVQLALVNLSRSLLQRDQRWYIEAGFREIKQEIGSAHTQTRNPDAVTNHLHFCMAATTLTWIYAAHLHQAPARRYRSENTTEYAFADVRRSLAKQLAREGFGIDCQDPEKSHRKPLISAVMRLVA